VFTFYHSQGNFVPFPSSVGGALGYHEESQVIGMRQAAILYKFAKATSDPKISAALLEKAADIKLRVDEPAVSSDLTPLTSDIEPPSTT
jgi:hypothetical protein